MTQSPCRTSPRRRTSSSAMDVVGPASSSQSNNKRKRDSEYPDVFSVGTKLRRYFDSSVLDDGTRTTAGFYEGAIQSVLDDGQLYHVEYNDGDREDMDRDEVIAAVQNYKRQYGTKKTLQQKRLDFFVLKKPTTATTTTTKSATTTPSKVSPATPTTTKRQEKTTSTPTNTTKRQKKTTSKKPQKGSAFTVSEDTTSQESMEQDDADESAEVTTPNKRRTEHSPRRSTPRRSTVRKSYTEPSDSTENDSEEEEEVMPVSKRPRRQAITQARPTSTTKQSQKKLKQPDSEEDEEEAEWDGADTPDDDDELELQDRDSETSDDDDDDDDFVAYKTKNKTTKNKKTNAKRNTKKKDDDDDNSNSTPTNACKPPSGNPKWTKASVYDHECEIPSDAEDQILAAAETSNVKASVLRHLRATTTAITKAETKEQPKGEHDRKHIKTPHIAGDHLPVLSHPQEMFDDMVQHLISLKDPFAVPKTAKDTPEVVQGIQAETANARKLLLPLIKALINRPLRVATMCSGTESPLLALDMLQKSLKDVCVRLGLDQELMTDQDDGSELLQIEHVFSCEIEPFKQAYIERNFRPPLLFRDIRELGDDKAFTAYGAEMKVPNTPGDVDLLIAGTSCVDYSNLNNRKKTISQKGESGQTFWGMVNWIEKTQPPIVIIENVSGAPWEQKVKIFNELGYTAHFKRLDTKDYYIPHTRNRGYLFAVKKTEENDKKEDTRANDWHKMLGNLKRPASASLDAFMLPNDDPRVLRGRARLTAESLGNDEGDRAGRTDWTKCETRHQYARSSEDLGEKRPLTGWSDSGKTVMPSFAWNEWAGAQVHRIHDLMDINMLRLAKGLMDCTFKTMVWNLSQNVDRDTIGKLGLCQCLTPTGVPYVTNRGGPLVGEELLLLQGIPADDLLFTKESEAQLKDLAGNAMSTTVVGAAAFCALIIGHGALKPRELTPRDHVCRSLVPRPLQQPSEVTIERILGEYKEESTDLGPGGVSNLNQLLEDARWSSRKCYSEGANESLPIESLVECPECGETCSKEHAFPPRRYEEHNYVELENRAISRKQPAVFKRELLRHLPMLVSVEGVDLEKVPMPEGVGKSLWEEWKQHVHRAITLEDGTLGSFRYTKIERSRVWTAHYFSDVSEARLEARLHAKGDSGMTWLLYTKTPLDNGDLRNWLEKPVARLVVSIAEKGNPQLLTLGQWQLCLPVSKKCGLSVRGVGDIVDGWRNRLGLKGKFELERQFEKIEVALDLDQDEQLAKRINGTYKVLPKCGAACGSLMKKENSERPMFLFLESGRKTLSESDTYVFADTCHRTSNNEHREIDLVVSPKFSPLFTDDLDQFDVKTDASTPGCWVEIAKSGICTKQRKGWPISAVVAVPVGDPNLKVQVKKEGWKVCPEIVSCTVPVTEDNKLLGPCLRHDCLELNMFKSKGILESLAFITSRLSIPEALCLEESEWVSIDRSEAETVEGDDALCTRCAPKRPGTKWVVVEKGKQRNHCAMEDGREAAVYEQQLKDRPPAWVVRLARCSSAEQRSLSIACNVVSLVQRAYGYFPKHSIVRNAALKYASLKECQYNFRIVPHVDRSAIQIDPLVFSSNKRDPEAEQPPHFKKFGLRKEQLRSLSWMLKQEESCDPFMEEEVTEEILPGLHWRAEGRVRRPVLVRGGIIADEVGYGKTAITLGLIDSAASNIPDPPKGPSEKLIPTKATLVIVPGHLMGQWPDEVKKFLGGSKRTVVLEDLQSFNSTTVGAIANADIVIVSFRVLCNEKYFKRLARLVGINPESFPNSGKGGRYFDSVYNQCLSKLPDRANLIKTKCGGVMGEIEKDAKCVLDEETTERVRLDGKKAIYKADSKSPRGKVKAAKVEKGEYNPWNFSPNMVDKDRMKSPPLEAFFWNRIIVDEFTYLVDTERERVLSLLLGLKSSFRWCLSGTPQHSNFNDIKTLAMLLGLHLGIDETLPGTKTGPSRGGGGQKAAAEQTGLENLCQFLEVRSMQWHERRHKLAQSFMDRYVRQNVAEIDEIPSEEHIYKVELPPAERAIYLELETHLKSLDMNSKNAQKSKKKSTSDRESRVQRILRESDTAEEALLKGCSHYDMDSEGTTASEKMDMILNIRRQEKKRLERELIEALVSCFRQHHRILELQPDWNKATKVEKGEVGSALNSYLTEVEEGRSVSHGADIEVHERLKKLSKLAEAAFRTNPLQSDTQFEEVNQEVFDSDGNLKIKKKDIDLEKLYPLKRSLHNYMHSIRAMGKELCGRIRSLRFVQHVHNMQEAGKTFECPKCNKKELCIRDVAILTSCGHFGCLGCVNICAAESKCIEYPCCSADVSLPHVVSSERLNLEVKDDVGGKYGRKLTAIVEKVKEIVRSGDRVIVFSQFDDLRDKVENAFYDSDLNPVKLKGTVKAMVNQLSSFQKEVQGKDDSKVLLLKMDDEQSAGLNLTNLNHAVFVHPLLAGSQQQYDAYETQAIGRIRRYGQKKTVHVHRFLVEDTIDTDIFQERGGRDIRKTTGVV